MNYKQLLKKIDIYKSDYDIKVIGKSYFKRKIFAVERNLNKNFATAIFVCSVHARENIATDLVCKMIDEGVFDEIKDFNISFILMANPDGVELCLNGIKSVPQTMRRRIIKINQGSKDFKLWKANGRGVDLNNNFDARFGTNKGSNSPSASGFAGKCFESEIETRVIVSYLKKKNPFFVIAYHTKGEEIFYNISS